MGDLNITQESIYNKLYDLNISKSPGPDMLHPRVLYHHHHHLFCSNNAQVMSIEYDIRAGQQGTTDTNS